MAIVPQLALVHIIDDDEAVRESLTFLLQSAGLIVKSYASGQDFLKVAADIGIGCVLTDVRMPDIDGLALQRLLAEKKISIPVIVMTGHADVPIAVQALKAGAVDFLVKPFDDEALLTALTRAMEISHHAHAEAEEHSELLRKLDILTAREKQVLAGLVVGNPNKVIANELGTSPRTIEVHRARVMEKMGAQSLSELVRMGVRLGLG